MCGKMIITGSMMENGSDGQNVVIKLAKRCIQAKQPNITEIDLF